MLPKKVGINHWTRKERRVDGVRKNNCRKVKIVLKQFCNCVACEWILKCTLTHIKSPNRHVRTTIVLSIFSIDITVSVKLLNIHLFQLHVTAEQLQVAPNDMCISTFRFWRSHQQPIVKHVVADETWCLRT